MFLKGNSSNRIVTQTENAFCFRNAKANMPVVMVCCFIWTVSSPLVVIGDFYFWFLFSRLFCPKCSISFCSIMLLK